MKSRLFLSPRRAATPVESERRPAGASRRVQVACLALGAASVAAAGCGGASPMPDLGRAEAAILAAKEAQPGNDRTASIYLSVAEQDLALAERACSRGDPDGARRFAARAEIDASLAALVARDAAVRRAVEETEEEATILEDALQHVSGGSK